MVNSRVLGKLRAGEFVRVAAISRVREPWLAEVVGRIGFDAIWLDMEHRTFEYGVVDTTALACRATGIDLMVRILKQGYTSAMRVLEAGANGIMVPHCCGAAEAREWVRYARFPPLGRRGFDGAGADADFMLAGGGEHLRHANAQTFLVLQIEDREAVECVDEIAAVEGVDLLFIGPGDLSISYGVPFQTNHPSMERAIDRVAEACAKTGRWWGLPVASPEAGQRFLDRGARFIVFADDHTTLVNGFRNAIRNYASLRMPDAPR